MNALWLAVVASALMGATGDSGTTTPSTSNSQPAIAPSQSAATLPAPAPIVHTPAQLRAVVAAALHSAATTEGAAKVDAVRGLIALFHELQADTQMAPQSREQLLTTIRARLQRIGAEVQQTLAKARHANGDNKNPVNAQIPAGQAVLAQRPAGPGFGAPGPAAGAPGAPAKDADYGQQLADLIQAVIAPGSWDVNGGTGTIYYWGGPRLMVVRQTSEAHEDLADLLQMLRN